METNEKKARFNLVYHMIRRTLQKLMYVYKLLNDQGLIGNVFQTWMQVSDND